jgi:hypothetical protein
MKLLIAALITISLFASCTDNKQAKSYGGTAELTLPKGHKLVNITWKDSNIWYLTRPMLQTDSAITYSFKEKSSYGLMEGTYIIHEVK